MIDLLIFLILFSVLVVLALILKKISNSQKPTLDYSIIEWLKSTQKSFDQNSSQMVKVLQENSKQLNTRLDRAADVISHVSAEVGKMSEIGRSMRELQEFLKSPKLRGNIGEQILKDLIKQIFPSNSFYLQYSFRNGEKVDAAIKTDAGILPIDSKFPMENFIKYHKAELPEEKDQFKKEMGRDILRHINDIATKYIRPDEGTVDFALMYVPSEAVFYEIVNMETVLEHAKNKRVYIVSPSTLYAHLQTILLSFEGRKIESKTREMLRLLHGARIDYGKVNDSLDILGKHLLNASNQFSNLQKGFSGMGQKLQSIKYIDE